MFDETVIKDLTELLGKSLTYSDIEAAGGYLFKNRAFDLHAVAGIDKKLSISPLNAAKILVEEADRKGRVEGPLRVHHRAGRFAAVRPGGYPAGPENMLFRPVAFGAVLRFFQAEVLRRRGPPRAHQRGCAARRPEYPVAIASIDICHNSELVKKYKTKVMEKVYTTGCGSS